MQQHYRAREASSKLYTRQPTSFLLSVSGIDLSLWVALDRMMKFLFSSHQFEQEIAINDTLCVTVCRHISCVTPYDGMYVFRHEHLS